MQHIVDIVSGDRLEFDLDFVDAEGKTFAPAEGDKYFFEVEMPGVKNIKIEQSENHFLLEELALVPGKYPFAAGVELAEGGRVTVLKKQENMIRVWEGVVEDAAL